MSAADKAPRAQLEQALGLLQQARQAHAPRLQVQETGTVAYIGRGVAQVDGLPGVQSEELVRFPGGALGLGRIFGRIGEIGYWVRTDATSKGIASEGTDAMLSLGFSTLNLHKITLRIAVGNDASIRVAEKLGFSREWILREELRINGTWVDHVLYSMLEHEYRPLRSRPQPA